MTVWVALELMFARNEGIECIELEPESQEDLAVLLPASGGRRHLSIQVKYRSKHWGKAEFVELVPGIALAACSFGPSVGATPERVVLNPKHPQ